MDTDDIPRTPGARATDSAQARPLDCGSCPLFGTSACGDCLETALAIGGYL